MVDLGTAIRPESLPPAEDVKKVERRLISDEKKALESGNFGVTDNTIVIVLKDAGSTDFVFYYLNGLGLNKLIFGSGQPLITGGQLKELQIRLPSHPEQQRIADCLSTLDARIAAETDTLAALKTHKQGLMQQLFPSPEGD